MKLKHLHIDSYKVFQDFDIDFCVNDQPADIIVIAGVNGTGKTTLLKEMLSPGRETIPPISKYSDGSVSYVGEDGFVTYVDLENSDEKKISTPFFAYKKQDRIGFYPASVTDTTKLQTIITKQVDKVIYEDKRSSADGYNEVQKMIDLIFQDFDLHTHFYGMNRERQLLFTNDLGDKFGIEGLSAGETQLLGKVFPLFTDEMRGKVILMDEPEESLHPSWQSNLVPVLRRCAKENDCQFILATHSPQIISSVHAEELRLLVREENGQIKAVTCEEGPYGWTVEKVLLEIQHVHNLRVPEVEEKLKNLSQMIQEEQTETDFFKTLWNEMEQTLGYSDGDLILMRMEMHRKKKQHEANA